MTARPNFTFLHADDGAEALTVPSMSVIGDGSVMNDRFQLPTGQEDTLIDKHFGKAGEGGHPSVEFAHGTTTLSFAFQGGVIVAVDSRSTMGSYIASGSVKKVIEINRYLLGTMAGGAADCSYWERELGRRARLYELRHKKRISVAAASKILAAICYAYKGRGLSMGTMVVGWDEGVAPAIYYVDNDGTRLKGNRFCVGSGGTYAFGVLDAGYRYDLSVDEAIQLGRRAIFHATHRDAYSGGTVNVYHMKEDGFVKISTEDVQDLFEEFFPHRKGETNPLADMES